MGVNMKTYHLPFTDIRLHRIAEPSDTIHAWCTSRVLTGGFFEWGPPDAPGADGMRFDPHTRELVAVGRYRRPGATMRHCHPVQIEPHPGKPCWLLTTGARELPRIIGLTGAAGAGKDTVAGILGLHKRVAFADALRREVCDAFGVSGATSLLTNRETKAVPTPWLSTRNCTDAGFCKLTPDHAVWRSPREIMQLWGTEYRRAQDADYWVKQVEPLLTGPTVVTDVRFDNEANLIRRHGGEIWQVARPGFDAHGGHASDVDGSRFAPDRVIHNTGSLDDLRVEVLR